MKLYRQKYMLLSYMYIYGHVYTPKNDIVPLTKPLSNKLQSIYMQHFPMISEVLGIHRVWKHLTVRV